MPEQQHIEQTIRNYLQEIDRCIEALSHKAENRVTEMFSWVLTPRRVLIARVVGPNVYLIRARADESLSRDEFAHMDITSDEQVSRLAAPLYPGSIGRMPSTYEFEIEDVTIIEDKNINALPVFGPTGFVAIYPEARIKSRFSVEQAKTNALDMYNNPDLGKRIGGSFVYNLQSVFAKYRCIIKRKNWVERKIHRYVSAYSRYLLPSHRNCYFEHRLSLGEEERLADFILARDEGMPALLVELENPSGKLFRKNGELTSEANHARNQIAEWVRFIDENPSNWAGAMEFLKGPKQRLIVMGRGLEQRELMLNSMYTDTITWSYDMLLAQARDRCNSEIAAQCSMLGISNPNLVS